MLLERLAGKGVGWRLGEHAIQSGSSNGEGDVVVMSAEEEARLSSANCELSLDIMEELMEIFAQVSETNFVETQFVQTLSNYKPSIVLEIVQHGLKNDSVEKRAMHFAPLRCIWKRKHHGNPI